MSEMDEQETVTQYTMRRIREEWEAPLRAEIERLEAENTKLREEIFLLRRAYAPKAQADGTSLLAGKTEFLGKEDLAGTDEWIDSDGNRFTDLVDEDGKPWRF